MASNPNQKIAKKNNETAKKNNALEGTQAKNAFQAKISTTKRGRKGEEKGNKS